jgi:hypothetical protein
MSYQDIKTDATQSIIQLLNLSPNSESRIHEVLKKTISYEPKSKIWVTSANEPNCIYSKDHPIDLSLIDKINEIGLIKAYIKFLLTDLLINPEQGLYLFDAIVIRNNNRIVFRAHNETRCDCLLVFNLNDTISTMIKK